MKKTLLLILLSSAVSVAMFLLGCVVYTEYIVDGQLNLDDF